MQKEQLIKILRDNHVVFNEALIRESVDGYPSDENAEYAAKLYEDLFMLATYGVQNGFNKVKGAIKGISDLIALLVSGAKNVSVKFSEIENNRKKILRKVGDIRMSIDSDMKNQLVANLDDCIAVTDAIISFRSDNPELCERLKESERILLEIKNGLENVADFTSVKAGDCQTEIFKILIGWRKAVSRYQCYTDSVEKLNGALEIVQSWSNLTGKVGLGARAKASADYVVYDPTFDDIHNIVVSAHFAERTQGLKRTILDYRNATERMYNVGRLTAEIADLERNYTEQRDRLNTRIAELNDKLKSLVIQYKNGEISPTVSLSRSKDCQAEIARCNKELESATKMFEANVAKRRKQLELANRAGSIRKNVADRFESFANDLEEIKNTDPAKFVLLCSRLNFDSIYDALTGRISDSGMNDLLVSIEVITKSILNDIAKQLDTGSNIDEIDAEAAKQTEKLLEQTERRLYGQDDDVQVGVTNVVDSQEQARLEMEKLAREMGFDLPPEQEEERHEDFDGIIHVDNDDK